MPEEIAPPFKLSVSKVKTYEDCKAKYNFGYNLRLPRKEWEHFALGKMLHAVLEEFHTKYINGCNDPYHIAMSLAYKNAMKEYSSKLSDESKKTAYGIVNEYLKKISEDKRQMKDILSVEKAFSFNITENIILNGAIDRIEYDTDGVLTVADYKTTKDKKYMKDFLQLLTYAFVVLKDFPDVKKIRGAFIMLRHNFERVEKDFSIDQILEIQSKYEDYAKNILETNLWTAHPTNLCGYCDFSSVCKEGREFLAKKDRVKHGATGW